MLKRIVTRIDDWLDKKSVRTILLTALVFLYGFFCILKLYFPQSTNVQAINIVEFIKLDENPTISQIISFDTIEKSVAIVAIVEKSKGTATKKQTLESQYINDMLKTAKEESKKYGIPVSIKISQAVIESGFGKDNIAKTMNNHYGIKHKIDFSAEEKALIFGRIKHKTTEFFDNKRYSTHAEFVKYESRWASIRHHSIFLRDRIDNEFNAGYAQMKGLSKKDYKKWALALQKAKYSTSPTYAKNLIRIIEQYGLAKYDK
jgi:flagellum-specific peptidoglycan hydrolase FlgJ